MSGKHVEKQEKQLPRLLFEILLVLIIVLLAVLLLTKDREKESSSQFTPPIQTEKQPETVQQVEVDKAKYTFVDDGVKFMQMDGAYFRPSDPFTHAEMAEMIYSLLGTNKVGKATFSDLNGDEDFYNAAATLKTLGVVSGARFHPYEPVTFDEFDNILSYFGAGCEETEEDMTRRDAVRIMSSTLSRKPEKDYEKVGTILDVSRQDEDFYVIADACLSEALPIQEPGYFFEGYTLRLIDEDGNVVVGRTVDGFTFDENGKYTSGNAELDEVIQNLLSEKLVDAGEHSFYDKNGNLKFRDEAALKLFYNYIVSTTKYVPRHFYDMGDTSWAADEALFVLTEHKGNCYNFASAFYELARALGFEAELFSGTMGERDDPHSWVEINMDGENKLFDPELEYTKIGHEYVSYYKRSESFAHKYDYKKE